MIKKLTATVLFFFIFLFTAFSWFEAEKEIYILCSMLGPGQHYQSVIETLETGNYLRYYSTTSSGTKKVLFNSYHNLRNSSCSLTLADSIVVNRSYSSGIELNKIAAQTATVGFACLAIFQLLLAFGAPLGHMAWGGRHKKLPLVLRIGSLSAAAIFSVGIIIVLERVQIVHLLAWPEGVEIGVWMLALLLMISVFGNITSTSNMERRVMTPIALILSCACFLVTFGL